MAPDPTVPPVLSDGVVTLRELRVTDVPALVEGYRDPQARRWTSFSDRWGEREAHERVRAVRRGWADGRRLGWAVEAAGPDGTPRYAGQLDIDLGPPPELGYDLAPWARGAGRMTGAVRLAADWAFTVAGLPVLHWACRAGHLASWRVAHACGFRFEGTRTLALPAGDGLVDAWTAVLLPGPPVAGRRPRTTWWPTPELDAGPVRLRPPGPGDLARHTEACDDAESRWWSALPRPYTADDAGRWLLDTGLEASLGHAVTWVIADPGDDRYLGTVDVHGMDRPWTPTGGEIGYRAHPDARGRGVVSAAVRRVVAHAFTPVTDGGLGRHRLQIGAAAGNTASRRVAERAGFRLWGEPHGDGVHGAHAEIVDDGAWYELLVTDPRS